MEKGHGLTRHHNHAHPADGLIAGWDRGKPAALDTTVASPLTPAILSESSKLAGAAAIASETRKLLSNGLWQWTLLRIRPKRFRTRGIIVD